MCVGLPRVQTQAPPEGLKQGSGRRRRVGVAPSADNEVRLDEGRARRGERQSFLRFNPFKTEPLRAGCSSLALGAVGGVRWYHLHHVSAGQDAAAAITLDTSWAKGGHGLHRCAGNRWLVGGPPPHPAMRQAANAEVRVCVCVCVGRCVKRHFPSRHVGRHGSGICTSPHTLACMNHALFLKIVKPLTPSSPPPTYPPS